ncbi:hypothetical protein LOD99_12461 [Oopsacas minuta]|uniref:Uncharacterized protein n=1 Tax=Oopsacas minuta TaxID=111878 RepID=A0AAV7JG73_9METZ|nr:hypothetical protein LOD99_12461 [Oopsacas minuta]
MATTSEEIDQIIQEFVAYKITPDNQLPSYNPTDIAAIDHFWSAMSRLEVVTSVDLSDSPLATLTYQNFQRYFSLYRIQMLIQNVYSAWLKKLKLIPVLY